MVINSCKCICIILFGILSFSANALPTVPSLNEFAINIDGSLSHITFGDSIPANVNISKFDTITGLGTITVTITGNGHHNFDVLLDHDIGIDPNNETGSITGTVSSNLSWEIDDPVFGDIYSNFQQSSLDNTNQSLSPSDVSMALGWDFFLDSGQSATINIVLSNIKPIFGPYMTQKDIVNGISNYDVYMSGTVTLSSSTPIQADLIGLEVTQAIQDIENSVTLVENKYTLVRAYIQAKGTDPVSVQASLKGKRGGVELPGSPLAAFNLGGSITASSNALSRRSILNDSLNFKLPDSWTSGTVELEIEPVGTSLDCMEVAGPNPNDCKTTVSFNATPAFEVKFVKIKYKNGNRNIETTDGDVEELEKRLLAIYPTARIDRITGSLDMGSGIPDAVDIIARLKLMRFLDDCWSVLGIGCERLYYGAIDQNGSLNCRICSSGETGGLASDIPGTVSTGVIKDNDIYGRNRHAHEIGHTIGRHHAVNTVQGDIKKGVCTEKASKSASDFPFIETVSNKSKATIGPLTLGDNKIIYGWDSNRNQMVDPEQSFELMSYCGNARWISSYTYEGVHQYINDNFPTSDIALAIPPVSYLVFRATIFSSTVVTFLPTVAFFIDHELPNVPHGDFVLVLRDISGNEIRRISFTPIELHQDIEEGGTPGIENIAIMQIPVEADPNIASVDIEKAGTVLGTVSASANPPSVMVQYPNGGEILSGNNTTVKLHRKMNQ